VIAGVALMILNRPRAVMPEPPPAGSSGPHVVPAVTSDQIGLLLVPQF